MRNGLAALTMLAAAGCVTAPYPDVIAAEATPVALGQRAHVGRFVIRPISVYEDSRCPAGVRCIWAGRLIVYALVDGPGVHQVGYFTLGVPTPVGGSSFTLSDVKPERFVQVALKPEDYRFTFVGGA